MMQYPDTVGGSMSLHQSTTDIFIVVKPAPRSNENRTGATLAALAQQVLVSAGSNWTDPASLSGDWYASSPCTHLAQRAKRVVADLVSCGNHVILDHPAFARSLPFWLRQFDDAQLPITIVFPIEGLLDSHVPIQLAAAWLRTLLDAERLSRGRPRIITPFTSETEDEQLVDAELGKMTHINIWSRARMPAALTRLRHVIVENQDSGQDSDFLTRLDLALQKLRLPQDDTSRIGSWKIDQAFLVSRLDDVEKRLEQTIGSVARLTSNVGKLQRDVAAQIQTIGKSIRVHNDALQKVIAKAQQASDSPKEELLPAQPQSPEDIPPLASATPHVITRKKIDASTISAEASATEAPDWRVEAIRQEALFDESYYLAHNPDVREAGLDPAHHYFFYGGMEGRDPSPGFWSAAYLTAYPDVKDTEINPLLHYIEFGRNEGRDPRPLPLEEARAVTMIRESPMFDGASYAKQVGLDPKTDAARHYYDNQRSGAIDPSSGFWAAAYLNAYPDVAETGFNPLAHFLLFGAGEGRDPRPLPPAETETVNIILRHRLFDAVWYCDRHGMNDPRSAARHFYENWSDNRFDPGPGFKSSWYLRINADVAANNMPAFQHYIQHGEKEGRAPFPRQPDLSSLLSASPQHWGALRLIGSPLRLQDEPVLAHDLPLSCIADISLLNRFVALSGGVGKDGKIPLNSAACEGDAGREACPEVADAWFSNEATICLRFNMDDVALSGQAAKLTAYQVDDGHVISCGTFALPDQGPAMLSFRLANPLFPLLIAVKKDAAAIASARLIPFPSLYRGGFHASEALAAIEDGGHIDSLSDQLLGQFTDAHDAPLAIARIMVDGRGSLGTEAIHNGWVLCWLERVMRIPVDIDAGPLATTEVKPLSRQGSWDTMRSDEGLRLKLPNNHIPTIAALVHRLSGHLSGDCTGNFIVANRQSGSVVATIRLPADPIMIPDIGDSQNSIMAWPSLVPSATAEGATGFGERPSIYLSINFGSEPRDSASLLLRSSPNLAYSVVQPVAHRSGDIHVVVRHSGTIDDLKNCLLSLSLQSSSENLSVTILCDALPDRAELEQHLPELPTRFADIHAGDVLNFASSERDQSLVFLDDSVVLPDHRALEILDILGSSSHVASMSCLMVSEDGTGRNVNVRSSGYFYDRTSAALKAADMFDAFPYTIYPVAFCHAPLTLVPAHARHLLDQPPEPRALWEAWRTFIVRSHEAGLVNMATSLVSATIAADAAFPEKSIADLPGIEPDTLIQITAS